MTYKMSYKSCNCYCHNVSNVSVPLSRLQYLSSTPYINIAMIYSAIHFTMILPFLEAICCCVEEFWLSQLVIELFVCVNYQMEVLVAKHTMVFCRKHMTLIDCLSKIKRVVQFTTTCRGLSAVLIDFHLVEREHNSFKRDMSYSSSVAQGMQWTLDTGEQSPSTSLN